MPGLILALLLFMNSAFADELVGFAAFENADYTTAYPHLMQAAKDGNEEAMYLLGRMYEFGYGVTLSYPEARNWYQKAAAQNYGLAQLSLGFLYDAGKGTPQNFKEAYKWYMKAADQGNFVAQRNIGLMYATGDGIVKNDAEAFLGSKKLGTKRGLNYFFHSRPARTCFSHNIQ
jgi:TPR repeat protein